ncbi:MAG: peptide-methionine (R)-S-oxide reductase MsrB [bacterium]|nr:peptide-methionine (R)-S-oxide reductase MsrB [bacterium]
MKNKYNKKITLISITIIILGLFVYFVSNSKMESSVSGPVLSEVNTQWNAPTASSPYVKPKDDELRKLLPSLSYNITQENGTETPYTSEHTKNTDPGIYVDIVSGAPLFSSRDKYDSATGWPSFVQPISPDALTYKVDKELGIERTEVRSALADSHLGHMFDDGPADRGGKRYCINGFALRFIPKDQMVVMGYGEYLKNI